MKRLFGRGHREEPEIVKELEKVGLEFWGDQTEMIGFAGHAKGHCDGMCKGVLEAPKTVHLAEFKTMNDKSFKQTKKEGVKLSKPTYYAQMQRYMHGLKLTRALFVAVNKNDDSWYIERVEYDATFAEALLGKEADIILAEIPPTKPFHPSYYECKFCSARGICHGGEEIHKTCRTCVHIDIKNEGKWGCLYHKKDLTTEEQRHGCDDYESGVPSNV